MSDGCRDLVVKDHDVNPVQGHARLFDTILTIYLQRLDARNAISTALSTEGSSIDYATRLSKILARRLNQPVYVGCSMSFAGLTAEEEMEGISAVVGEILEAADKNKADDGTVS